MMVTVTFNWNLTVLFHPSQWSYWMMVTVAFNWYLTVLLRPYFEATSLWMERYPSWNLSECAKTLQKQFIMFIKHVCSSTLIKQKSPLNSQSHTCHLIWHPPSCDSSYPADCHINHRTRTYCHHNRYSLLCFSFMTNPSDWILKRLFKSSNLYLHLYKHVAGHLLIFVVTSISLKNIF